MDATQWTLTILVVLMAACCLPMLFMKRHSGGADRESKAADKPTPKSGKIP